MSLGIYDSYDNLIKRISNKNVKIEFGLCIIFAQLLRIRKYNTYLTKIVLKLTNKKKILTCQEYKVQKDKFQNLIENIEILFDKLPKIYEFNTRIQKWGRGHTGIGDSTKDFWYRVKGLLPVLPIKFGEKFLKVSDLLHNYECQEIDDGIVYPESLVFT